MKADHSQRFLLTFLLSFFSYFIWGQVALDTCSVCQGQEKKLIVQSITDSDLLDGTTFHVYWYFGDGHYKKEWVTLNDPLSSGYTGFPMRHIFYDQGTPYGDGFVEITRVYTEDNPPPPPPPPKRFGFGPISCDPGPCVTPIITPPDSPLKVEMNRNLVRDHTISFIINYKAYPNCSNHGLKGKLGFTFPTDALEVTSTSHDAFLTTTYTEPLLWEIPYSNKGGRVFVNAKVKSSVSLNQNLDIKTTFDFFKNGAEGADPCQTWEDKLEESKIEASHDPNALVSPSSFIGCELQDNFIQYVIRFQNIGAGEAKRVEIRDIIPEAFSANISAINTIYPTHSITGASLVPTLAGREARWVIDGKYLRGGSENLLGVNQIVSGQPALESETIDSLVFQIQFDSIFKPAPCDAIINQAEIIFDCNSSIHTNPYILKFGCWQSETGSALDSICMTCDEGNIQMCHPIEMKNSFDLEYYASSRNSANQPCQIQVPEAQIPYSQFSWYPPVGLSATNIPYPTFSPTRSTDYYRVRAYKENNVCKREILKLPIKVSCQLEIATTTDECIGNNQIKVTATITDHEPGADIVWMTPYPCNTAFTFDTIVSGPFPTGIQLKAIDRNTNCAKTIELTLNDPNCDDDPHLPFWAWVAIAFGGIFLIYLFSRIISNSNENQ